ASPTAHEPREAPSAACDARAVPPFTRGQAARRPSRRSGCDTRCPGGSRPGCARPGQTTASDARRARLGHLRVEFGMHVDTFLRGWLATYSDEHGRSGLAPIDGHVRHIFGDEKEVT